MARCLPVEVSRDDIDRRLLATLEFLSVSGLRPTVSSLQCSHVPAASAANAAETSAGDAVEIVAVNGIAIAGGSDPTRPGSIADITIRKLLTLQGTMKPRQIISLMSYPGTDNTLAVPGHGEGIHVEFAPLSGAASARRSRRDSGSS